MKLLIDRSYRRITLRPHSSLHLLFFLLIFLLAVPLYSAHSKDSHESDLTAQIMVPSTGSMVRGDVPVYGLAYGEDFKEYSLEYGYGLMPEEWQVIVTSLDEQRDTGQLKKINFDLGKTVAGNLGMWSTGLSEYPYADYPVDLPMGPYTLRLKVTGLSGREITDTVNVDVGRVILNCCEISVASPDGQACLVVFEHSLPEVAKVISLVPLREIPSGLKDNSELRLISGLYHLRPAGQAFSREVMLRIKADSDEEKSARHAGICRYDPSAERWQSLSTFYDQATESYFTKITSFSDDLAIFGLFASEKIINARFDGAEARRITPSSNIMIHNTFDDGPQQWENRYGQMGGAVSVVEDGCLIGKCLKVESGGSEGNLGVSGIPFSFDVRTYPLMEFDYKMMPGTKINVLIKVGGIWYDLVFSDDEKHYWDINMEKIGEISDVMADGNWHHVTVNLHELLKSKTDRFIVEDLVLADWDATGFKRLAFGRAPKGACYYLDEFKIMSDLYFWHIDGAPVTKKRETDRGDSFEESAIIIEGSPELPSEFNSKLSVSFDVPEKNEKRPYIFRLRLLDENVQERLKNIDIYYQGTKVERSNIYSHKNVLDVFLRELRSGSNRVDVVNRSGKLHPDSISLLYLDELPIDISLDQGEEDYILAATPSFAANNNRFLDGGRTDEATLSFYVNDLDAPLRLILSPVKADQPSLWSHQNRMSVEVNLKILKTLTYGAGEEDLEMMIPSEYLNNGMNFIKFKHISLLNQLDLQRIQIK